MRFDKAVKMVESYLSEGKDTYITYHPSRYTQNVACDMVTNVSEYEYKGKTCKAISVNGNQIIQGSFIIESVETK